MPDDIIADDSALNTPAGDPPAGDPPAGDPPAGAPEVYEDFTLPEGVTMDASLLEKAVPVFKELGLTQDQAQKLVSLEAEQRTAQAQQFVEQIASWEASIKADKEIGGDKFEENLGVAKVALDKFGTPELKDFMEGTGAGSHPEIVRLLVRVGQAIKEDNPGGGTPPAPSKDIVERMYPNNPNR